MNGHPITHIRKYNLSAETERVTVRYQRNRRIHQVQGDEASVMYLAARLEEILDGIVLRVPWEASQVDLAVLVALGLPVSELGTGKRSDQIR